MDQEELLQKIEEWNQSRSYRKIIETVEALPPEDRGYDLACQLARAYNNLGALTGAGRDYLKKAADLLVSVREEGKEDPLWHYRLGYSYYHLDKLKEAAICFREALRLDPGDEDAREFLKAIQRNSDTKNKAGSNKGDKVW